MLFVRALLQSLSMLKGPIALGTIRTGFVLALRLVVQSGTLVLLALMLGAEGFGLYTGVGAMAVLLGGLASFGTQLTLLRDVSRSSIEVSAALRLALGTTAFCGSGLLLIYFFLAHVLMQMPDNVYWVVLFFGVAEIIFQPFLVVAAMELHGRGKIALSQLLLIQPLCLRLLAASAITGIAPENPLYWYALCHLAATMLPLGVRVLTSSTEWHHPFQWRVARCADLKGLAGYAVVNLSANGVTELDKILAVRFLPSAVAGIYSAASRIVGSLVLPVMAMMLAAMPRLFRDGAVVGKTLHCWLFAFAVVYGVFVAIMVMLVAPRIELLLGVEYVGIGEFIQLLAFAVPAVCVRAAATNVLTTFERPWIRISLEFCGWVVIAVLGYIFVRVQGGLGLPLAIICVEWLLATCSVILVRKISNSPSKSSIGVWQK